MASPVDAGRIVTNTQPGVRPWTVTLPNGIVAGDLLLVVGRGGGTITTLLPTGWSWLIQNDQTDASDDTVSVIYKWADGTEGTTLSWDMGFAIKGSAIAWRITGAINPATQPPELVSSLFTTVVNSANPASISPTGGSKDYLFITIVSKDGIGVVTAAPSGYTNLSVGTSAGSGGAATNATVAGSSKQATTATEDPGIFTHAAATTGGVCYTIAIHPGAAHPTYFGVTASSYTFGAVTQAQRKVFGQIALPITFIKDVKAQRKTFGQIQSPFIFGKAVSGQRTVFGQIALPINISIITSGIRLGLTQYGVVALPITFTKDVRGQRRAFGQIALPITFLKDVKGQRKTFGKIDFPIIFIKEAVGRKQVFGQLSMPTLFGKEVAAQRKTFGRIALPLIFLKEVIGRKQTFGKVALPVNVAIIVDGRISSHIHYGAIALPIIFDKQVSAQRKTFGQITAPFVFGSASQGRRLTFSRFDLPLDLDIAVKSGRIGAHSLVDLELIFATDIDGILKASGIILNNAIELYLGEQDILAVYVGNELVWP